MNLRHHYSDKRSYLQVGETSEPIASRPSWAMDGSFLAFHQLAQTVPEFNKFLINNPIIEDGLTPEQGSELLGARMIGHGRGAPVDLATKFDDPALAADSTRNNNFDFSHAGSDIVSDQSNCPFSSHIRKTKYRADLGGTNVKNQIIRVGTPYGPELSSDEAASNTTITEHVAYQSVISNGFHFLQQNWANNPKFVPGKNDSTPGFDPIIGANHGQSRTVSGLDPTNFNKDFTLVQDFVVSRGGEYFLSIAFSPCWSLVFLDSQVQKSDK
ncbi:hypothetical protein M422DRAFT_275065 [Sphaerobolus stellatus SS14]|uniref:Peroxidase n=1 Tax=Sphaerobolus stellatus (strain SS14) TaxID=990650 RepID=A0A0C9TQH4_SPHS4|nr:hypothetical protein M422DRAFT_275065 [Sphaerobolus stellatus SS14]